MRVRRRGLRPPVQRSREPQREHGLAVVVHDVHGPVVAGPEVGPALDPAQHLAAGPKGFVANGVEVVKLRSLPVGEARRPDMR